MLPIMWLAAILAGVVHILFFCLESLWWTTPNVRERFRQAAEQADATKLLAFNQGFYNLFLAVGTFAGLALVLTGHFRSGMTLVSWNCLSMLGAAIVLAASAPQHAPRCSDSRSATVALPGARCGSLGDLTRALAVFALFALASSLALNHVDQRVALILVLPGYVVQAWLFEKHHALGGVGYVGTVVTVSALVWTLIVLGLSVPAANLARRLSRSRPTLGAGR